MKKLTRTILLLSLILACKEKSQNTSPADAFIGNYYTVISPSGLNLRKESKTSSLSLAVLKFGSTGKILDRQPNLLTIQNRKGYWLKVYSSEIRTEGWLFSGFIDVSPTENSGADTPHADYSFLKPISLELEEDQTSNLPKTAKLYKKLLRHNIEIGDYTYTDEVLTGCVDGLTLHTVGLKNTSSKREYRNSESYETIVREHFPAENVIITKVLPLCSCGRTYDHNFYFFDKESVYRFHWPLKKEKAICGPDNVYPSIEIRYEPFKKQRVMVREERPYCSYSDGYDLTNPIIQATEFLIIDSSQGKIDFKVYSDKQLSTELRAEWETLTPFSTKN